MPFTFKKRRSTQSDVVSRVRSMRALHVYMQPHGGRSKLALITGRSRRAVDSWFVDRSLPPAVAIMLDQVRGIREAGLTLSSLCPEVVAWPDPVQSLEFLPFLIPVDNLRPDVQQLLQTHPEYTPEETTFDDIDAAHFVPPPDYTLDQVYEAQLRVKQAVRTGTLKACSSLDMWLATRRKQLTFAQAYPSKAEPARVDPRPYSVRAIDDARMTVTEG